MKLNVTKIFEFEMAHALTGHDGACRNIHGHSYRLSVTLQGEPLKKPGDPKDGMVIDFSDLKKLVSECILSVFDHALVLNESSPFRDRQNMGEPFHKLVFVPFQPTCENLLIEFKTRLESKTPSHLRLQRIVLQETSTSFSEWNYGI